MNNTATNTTTCPTVRKQIGKTTYIVRVHFSQTAKRRWRTKSSVCFVKKSAKCDFFLNLMKKSLTFRLWQDRKIHLDFLRCKIAPFDIEELRELTSYDELELDMLGDEKQLCLSLCPIRIHFQFLVSMMYTQLFNLLCDKADDVYGGGFRFMCAVSLMSWRTGGQVLRRKRGEKPAKGVP